MNCVSFVFPIKMINSVPTMKKNNAFFLILPNRILSMKYSIMIETKLKNRLRGLKRALNWVIRLSISNDINFFKTV